MRIQRRVFGQKSNLHRQFSSKTEITENHMTVMRRKGFEWIQVGKAATLLIERALHDTRNN